MTLDAGQVFGASERLQPALEAPASVSFITAEEIARYGYRTLADILSASAGLYVVDDRNYSVIGTRGFALPGDYNTRMLLLVNGHRVNDNVFGQAEDRRRVRPRSRDVRARRNHPRPRLVALWRQRVLRRRERDYADRRVARRAARSRSKPERSAPGWSRAAVGHRFANGVDVALSGTYEQQRWRRPALLSGIRHAGHEQRRGRGARWRRRQAILRPPGLQGPDRDRRVRHPPARRADRLVRHVVQRAGDAASKPPIGTRWWMRNTGASFGGTRVTFRASFDRFTFDGIYPFAGEPERRADARRAQQRGRDAVERGQRADSILRRPAHRAGRGRVHRQREPGSDRPLRRSTGGPARQPPSPRRSTRSMPRTRSGWRAG